MKQYFIVAPAIAKVSTGLLMLVFLSFCTSKKDDPKYAAKELNKEQFDRKGEKDAAFVVRAIEINMEEILLGQIAQTQASSNDIKDLGRMMVEDHTKSLEELKALAQNKSIYIPESPTKDVADAANKLKEKSGREFDKEYSEKMVKAHEDAIKEFEKASESCKDPDIRAWAAKVLPDLRNHLDHSTTCLQNFK